MCIMHKASFNTNTNHEKLKEADNMSVLDNFETWKDFLANKLEQAQSQGMDQQTIANVDRKSTRLNSSHVSISYAVFCLKKKTTKLQIKTAINISEQLLASPRFLDTLITRS